MLNHILLHTSRIIEFLVAEGQYHPFDPLDESHISGKVALDRSRIETGCEPIILRVGVEIQCIWCKRNRRKEKGLYFPRREASITILTTVSTSVSTSVLTSVFVP